MEREGERNKKKKKVHACARSAFSARVHSSNETSLELVSHKFSRKLVSEIRHFSHPRWLPLPLLLLFSSLYVPCTSLLYTPPPSWCPFSTRNLLLTKDRPGRSSYRQIESALHFGPLYPQFFVRITPQLLRFVLLPYFFFLYRYYDKCQRREGGRTTQNERQDNRTRVLFIFLFPLSSMLLFISVCLLHPFETKSRKCSCPSAGLITTFTDLRVWRD